MTTAHAQAVPRQPPPPTSPAPTSQPPAPGTTSAPVTSGEPSPGAGARLRPVTDVALPEAAPVINFAADGVSLEEALRLTLRHDSTIQLSAASADRLAGFAQEQAGIFDTCYRPSASYSYRVQELTEARKEDEREKRRKLAEFLSEKGPDVSRAPHRRQPSRQILSLPRGNGRPRQVDQLDRREPDPRCRSLRVLDALIAGGNPAMGDAPARDRTDFMNAAIRRPRLQPVEARTTRLRTGRLNRADLGDVPDDEVF